VDASVGAASVVLTNGDPQKQNKTHYPAPLKSSGCEPLSTPRERERHSTVLHRERERSTVLHTERESAHHRLRPQVTQRRRPQVTQRRRSQVTQQRLRLQVTQQRRRLQVTQPLPLLPKAACNLRCSVVLLVWPRGRGITSGVLCESRRGRFLNLIYNNGPLEVDD